MLSVPALGTILLVIGAALLAVAVVSALVGVLLTRGTSGAAARPADAATGRVPAPRERVRETTRETAGAR